MQRLGMALKLAYNRDGKTGLLRVNYGLLTDSRGPSRRPAWGQGLDSSNDPVQSSGMNKRPFRLRPNGPFNGIAPRSSIDAAGSGAHSAGEFEPDSATPACPRRTRRPAF